jgi:hypothetical protein
MKEKGPTPSPSLDKCCEFCDGNIGCDKKSESCQCHRPSLDSSLTTGETKPFDWEKEIDHTFEAWKIKSDGAKNDIKATIHILLNMSKPSLDSFVAEKIKEFREKCDYQVPDGFLMPDLLDADEIESWLSQAFHDLREQVKREDIKIVMDTYHGINNPQVRAGIARAAKKLKGSLSPL